MRSLCVEKSFYNDHTDLVDSPSLFSPTKSPWPKSCAMTVTPSLMAPPSIPRSQRPAVEAVAVVVVVGVTEVVAVDMVTVVDMVEDDLEATVVVVVDAVTAVVEVSEHANI